MPTPVIRRYQEGDRLYVQAQQIWLILTGLVMNASNNGPNINPVTITYGELAIRMGKSNAGAAHTLGRQLGIVGKMCIDNKLPALNAIVVGKATGVPGAEVLLTPGNTVKQELRAVKAFNWYSVRPPTTGTFRQVWEG